MRMPSGQGCYQRRSQLTGCRHLLGTWFFRCKNIYHDPALFGGDGQLGPTLGACSRMLPARRKVLAKLMATMRTDSVQGNRLRGLNIIQRFFFHRIASHKSLSFGHLSQRFQDILGLYVERTESWPLKLTIGGSILPHQVTHVRACLKNRPSVFLLHAPGLRHELTLIHYRFATFLQIITGLYLPMFDPAFDHGCAGRYP